MKSLGGVFDVGVRLLDEDVGEAEISYDPGELKLDEVKSAISAASGPKHNFIVLSIVEER